MFGTLHYTSQQSRSCYCCHGNLHRWRESKNQFDGCSSSDIYALCKVLCRNFCCKSFLEDQSQFKIFIAFMTSTSLFIIGLVSLEDRGRGVIDWTTSTSFLAAFRWIKMIISLWTSSRQEELTSVPGKIKEEAGITSPTTILSSIFSTSCRDVMVIWWRHKITSWSLYCVISPSDSVAVSCGSPPPQTSRHFHGVRNRLSLPWQPLYRNNLHRSSFESK